MPERSERTMDPDARPEGAEAEHAGIQRFAAKVAEAPRSDLQRWTVQGNLRMLAEEVGYLVGLHRRGRWNIENTPSGVRLCRGDHDTDWCEWEEYAPAERLRALEAERAQAIRTLDAEGVELMQDGDPMTLGDRIASNHAALCERARALEAENEALREYFDACEAELQATQDFADGNTQSYNGGELRARIKHARLTILHLEPNR